jgi:hypothetical protein
MEACPNCGAYISCGCQLRTATDSKVVCQNCLESYEQQLAVKNSQNLAQDPEIKWAYNQINK